MNKIKLSQRGDFSAGFSLMEVIVVLAIIGGIISIAVSRLGGTNSQETSKLIRKISVDVKQIRNRAKLYGTTYRLAIKMDPEGQSYWVEKSSNVTLIDKKALDEQREKAKSQFRDSEEKDPSPSAFQPDTSFFKKEQILPRGYSFKLVESGSQDNIFADGTAYVHFFPQGYIEPCLIQIQDPKKNIWTLVFNPITGQADVIAEAKTLKELTR